MSTENLFGETFAELTKCVSELGFGGVLYSFYPKPMYMNAKVQPVLHFSSSFAPFVAHYLKNNYGNRDFVLRLALQGLEKPLDWWEAIHAGLVTPEEQAVTEDARQNFGIHHGLSIPVLRGTFAVAGISVFSKNPQLSHYEALKQATQEKLQEVAKAYHKTIMRSKEELRFFTYPLIESLNSTEKKVLSHVLTGRPMKSIAHELQVSSRYGEKVLRNLRQEFGDISSNELIYILGMVHIHEYL